MADLPENLRKSSSSSSSSSDKSVRLEPEPVTGNGSTSNEVVDSIGTVSNGVSVVNNGSSSSSSKSGYFNSLYV
jgi:hypothetical protein